MKLTETADIILAWLKEEFPKHTWCIRENHQYNYGTGTQTTTECLSAEIGGIMVELQLSKDLDVAIYTKIPFRQSSKIREVRLSDPTSIDDLKEVVKHTIKITTNPFCTPR